MLDAAEVVKPQRVAWVTLSVAATLLAVLVVTQPAELVLAGMGGLLGLVSLVRYPFFGLLLLVFFAQLGGVVEWAARPIADVFLEGIALATILGVLINSYRESRNARLGPDSLPFRLAVLYAIVLVTSYLLADNGPDAKVDVAKRLVLVLLLYLILRGVDSLRAVKALILAVCLSTAFSGATSVAGALTNQQFFHSEVERDDQGRIKQIGAGSLNATTTSQMMIPGAAIALLLAARRRTDRMLFVMMSLAGAAGIVLSAARSSALIGLVGLGWFFFKQRRHPKLPAILLVSFLVGCALLPLVPQKNVDRLSQLISPSEDFTLGRRVGYQLIGLDLLTESPIFGVGAGNFQYRYMDFQYRFMPNRTPGARELHNMYLSVAVQSGVTGLICFGGMLLASLSGLSRVMREDCEQELRDYAEALHFGFVLFLIACFFSPMTTNKLTWMLTGIAAALPIVASRAKEQTHSDNLAGSASLVVADNRS